MCDVRASVHVIAGHRGWTFFFFSFQGHSPPHGHGDKGHLVIPPHTLSATVVQLVRRLSAQVGVGGC